jgi:uncharacterized protein
MSRNRVVLDTNVVVSALVLSHGRFAWLRDGWHSGAFTPLVSSAVAMELMRVLGYPKFGLDRDAREALLADYLPMCEVVAIPARLPGQIPACRDPDDRKFLELALAGRASFVVTGDSDLLAVAASFAVPIVNPARFRELLSASGSVVRERASVYVVHRKPSTSRAAA